MRKLFIISVIAVLGIALHAQSSYYDGFASEQIQGDTSYYPNSNGYKAKKTTGVVSFTFAKTDVADSLSFARIEGRDATDDTWKVLTGTAALVNTSTDGVTKLYTTTPNIYLYYRVGLACATGDTVSISNQTFMIKED